MAVSNVERDLTKMLAERGIVHEEGINEFLKKEFGQDFHKQMGEMEKHLNQAEQALYDYEQELIKILRLTFMESDSIIDDIIYHLNTGMDISNITQLLGIGNGQEYLQKELQHTIEQYSIYYEKYKEQFIDNLKFVNKVSEAIREDEQYYTIGIETKNHQLKNAVLSSEQWYKLISDNKYFSLQKDASGHRNILALNRQATGETYQVLGKDGKTYTKDILSKTRGLTAGELAKGITDILGGPNSRLNKSQALQELSVDPISQQIWDALQNTEIYTMKSLQQFYDTDNRDILSKIFSSRKYEILNSGIWDNIYQETDANKRQSLIWKTINNIQAEGMEMENIFGGARGDTLLLSLGNYYSTQQKFYGSVGKQKGFNVIDRTALNNTTSFYKDENKLQKASEQYIENLGNSEVGQKIIQKEGSLLAYQEVNNGLFFNFFTTIAGLTVTEEGQWSREDFEAALF